jgi:CHAT domain-containing protein
MKRLALAAVALAATLLPAAARLTAEEGARAPSTPEAAAARFLEAFRSSDAAAMRRVLDDAALVPHRVADALLALHETAVLSEPPRPSDALEAAAAFAHLATARPDAAGLPAVIAEWATWGREQLARSRRLRGVLVAVVTVSAPAISESADPPEPASAPDPGRPGEPLPEAPASHPTPGPHEAVAQLVRAAAADLDTVGSALAAVGLRLREGTALDELGRPEEAIAAHRQALRHAEALRWPGGVASVYRRIGRIETRRRNYPAVVEAYERAFEVSERFGTLQEQALDLTKQVVFLAALSRHADALPLADRALAAQEALGEHGAMGTVLLRQAWIRKAFGQGAQARELFDRARAEFAVVGDRRMVARARLEAAMVTPAVPENRAALVSECEAIAAEARAVGDREMEMQAELRRGSQLIPLGWRDQGLAALRRAVELAADMIPPLNAVAWSILANAVASEEPEEALRMRERVIEILEGGQVRTTQLASAYLELAAIRNYLGRFAEAVESCRKGVALAREVAHRHGEGFGGDDQARVREIADMGCLAALGLLEQNPAARTQATAAAFDFGEVSRASLLAEALRAGPSARTEAPALAALRRRVRDARERLLALAFGDGRPRPGKGERGAPSSAGATPDAPASAVAIVAARRDLDAATAALRDASARDELLRRRDAAPPAPPVSLEDAQAALPEATALVLHQQEGTHGWAVVVTQKRAHLVDLGDPRGYDAAAKAWERALASPDGDEGEHAETLYDAVWAPIVPFVPPGSTVLVSPDGPLAFLPFEAMRNRRGQRLRVIERWAIAYVPSATVYVAKQREGATAARDALVALGDPVYPTERPGVAVTDEAARSRGLANLDRLPGTGDEVRQLGTRFPGDRRTLLLREEATRARLEAALTGVGERLRVLHLACHGFADASDPMQSGLVLSELDVLTVSDVARSRVPADLVVLSACESGRGTVRRGEGTMGFVRAFLRAGAHRVLVATQRVGDEKTRDVMRDFYAALLGDGLSPALALATAKRARIAAGGPAAHPYAWSALVLWD